MDEYHVGIVIGLVIGVLVGGLIGIGLVESRYIEEVEDLGSAICEEEFGMDYESYYKGKLYCKEFIESEGYDGIKVITKESEG